MANIFLLMFVIIFCLQTSCYLCFKRDPQHYIEELATSASSGHDSRTTINDKEEDYSHNNDLMYNVLRSHDFLSLKKFDKRSLVSSNTFNVDSFGARGDGKTDDTQAFVKAWKHACSSRGGVLVVPRGKTYSVKPIRFAGPCNSGILVQIYGTIEASNDRSDYKKDGKHWLMFDSISNLRVQGGGTIDGNGQIWWQNSCKVNKNKPCRDAPTALTFNNCNNVFTSNLKIKDAQQMHLVFDGCSNVTATSLTIAAPEDSPNTDGIHITNSQKVTILNPIIGTGDDCISIVSGSRDVLAKCVTCGPGHGISIGSLGSDNSKAYVTGVTIDGAKISSTQNGVRIKTWQGGSEAANNIYFKNIVMDNVYNPIIIDQNYCDQDGPCKQQKSAVQVKNVVYQNIKGTSASEVAIKFACSNSIPCQGIQLQNINLKYGKSCDDANAGCSNTEQPRVSGNVYPLCEKN